jgi:hypothetical protein
MENTSGQPPPPEYNQMTLMLAKQVKRLGFAIILLLASAIWYLAGTPGLTQKQSPEPVSALQVSDDLEEFEGYEVGSIDEKSGLIVDRHWEVTRANCTSCHSASLITQIGASREEWLNSIKWMQETQNLWDLGENEEKILDYLEKNYGPQKHSGGNAEITEWYEID